MSNSVSDLRRETRNAKLQLLAWLIPIVTTLAIALLAAFFRLTIGRSDQQEMDYRTKPFVPGESPYSTGPDSR